MLGKLIKYDCKAMFRNMLPIYVVVLVLAFICALMFRFNFDMNFIFTIFSFLFFAALEGSIIVNIVMIVKRFSSGLLKNEGYLNFALPVKTSTHIIAKVINAMIWTGIEALVIALCVVLMMLVMGSIDELKSLVHDIYSFLGIVQKDVVLYFLRLLLLITLESVAAVSLIYAAIAIGHLFRKHSLMIICAFLIVVIVARTYLFKLMMDNAIFVDKVYDANELLSDPVWFILPLLLTALYSLITWFILDRKLNLE